MAQFTDNFDEYSIQRREYVRSRLKKINEALFNTYEWRLAFPSKKSAKGFQPEDIKADTYDGKAYKAFRQIAENLIQEYENECP